MLNNKKAIFILPAIKGGGAERVVLNLYKALEVHLGYECHIISLKRDIDHDIEGFTVHFIDELKKIKKTGLYRLTYRRKMANKIDQFIDDNIGADSLILSNMLLSDKIMSLSRHRVFHIIHNEYKKALLDGKSIFKKFQTKINIENIYKNKPLVFISRDAKDSFINNFKSNMDKHVIYNPIDSNELESLAKQPIETIQDDYIVHIGRFNRAKRHDRLLKALALTADNTNLLILGSGKLENKIKQQIIELNVQKRVILGGFKSNPYPYLKASKGLILTSDFEGLPMVLLEALSLNIPVLSTDCSAGIREAVGSDFPGLMPINDLPAIAEFINDMLKNPSKYKKAMKREFYPEIIAVQYDKLNNFNH